jgi:hypothetical protein
MNQVYDYSSNSWRRTLVARLTSRYPAISESTVASVVHDVHARFDGRPLRDFVPLLVERTAKSELDRLHATVG